MRAAVVVALIALLTMGPVVGLAAQPESPTPTPTTADTSTPTATPTESPTPTTTPTAADSRATETPTTTGDDSADSDDQEDGEFTLEYLKSDGPRQANSPDSVRMGTERAFWSVYWPANNPFASPGEAESGQFLPPGHTVGRNEIYLRTWSYQDLQTTVHVVYWNKGTKTVKQGNTTTEEAVARNVTHVTHEVTFDRGRPTVEIPLQQHDKPVQVTMWIEGYDFAKWRFSHHSIATTQSVQIDSAGDYLASVIADFLIWILIGGFVVGILVKKALERAGTGPGYGYTPWIIGLSIATGLGAALAYESLADLVVNARIFLAAYVVGVFGVVLLETYQTNVSRALFLRPTLQHTESPTGEDAYDIVDAEATSEKIVRSPDGKVSVVRRGILPFLARVFGKSARLENVEKLRTRVPLRNSSWDEMFVTDPEADDLLTFQPASWTLSAPPLTKVTAPQYAAVVAAAGLSVYAFAVGSAAGPFIGGAVAVGVLGWLATPVEGHAEVDPAPVHIRSAFGSMVGLSEDIDNAKRFDELRQRLDEERISKQRDVDQQIAEHDGTLLSGMLDPDGNIPAAEAEDNGGESDTEDPDNDDKALYFPDDGTSPGGEGQ